MAQTWLTVEEMARRLQVTPVTIERWIEAGLLPRPEVRNGARQLCLEARPRLAGAAPDLFAYHGEPPQL
jgi:excisionase family DNA binding protein